MTLEIVAATPQNPDFVAYVRGIDITLELPAETITALEQAIDHYGVLIFPDQQINDQQQYAFSSQFGRMEKATGDINNKNERRLSMDINDISNLGQRGEVLARDDRRRLFGLGNMLWHSDSSFKSTPANYSLLSARVIPPQGGNTQFADMRAAWDQLNEPDRQVCEDLVCLHSQIFSRGKLGFEDFTDEERDEWSPVLQRLVRRHPRTQRQSLFLSSHIGTIRGWPMPEARIFLADLTEHATQSDFVFTHSWKTWDLLMWDNRVVMHRARRYDPKQRRDLHRTTVAGDGPTV